MINSLLKLEQSGPCSTCGKETKNTKAKICGQCGERKHVACMTSKPKPGYWFCEDCLPGLLKGHRDPALNVPLHDIARGARSYPGLDEATVENLKEHHRFVRGVLVANTGIGDRMVPPVCIRPELVQ